ncbi:hypothetical protein ACFE04_005331 [Oxalis oulophora]
MSTLAGTLKLSSLALQHRVFSNPWVMRRSSIFCLREKDYNSSSSPSMPVRYIPKKSRKKNQLTNESDYKNRKTFSNNTNPLRIDSREQQRRNNDIKKLRFADSERERNEVEETGCSLQVTNECQMKVPVEEVLFKEAGMISRQSGISQPGTFKGNKALPHNVRVVSGGGLVKEPDAAAVKAGRITQQENIDKVGVFQACKLVEDVKKFTEEKEEEKIVHDLNEVNGLNKEAEKVLVMEGETSQQKDVSRLDILQSSKEAENVKILTEVKGHQNLDVKEPAEIVVKEKKISQQKDKLKGGIFKGSEALQYVKKFTEEIETSNVRWIMDNEHIEEPNNDPDEEIEIDLQKETGVLGFDETVRDVEKATIVLLAKRAYTAVELKKKLQAKKFPTRIIDSIIDDFQRRGLVNDSLYAECYSRSRWSSSTWGPGRIKNALSQKGVSETDVKKAVKVVFEEDESGEDHELILGMSKLSMDHLFVQASKQWLRRPKEKRKASIIRWLEYRGFRWNRFELPSGPGPGSDSGSGREFNSSGNNFP